MGDDDGKKKRRKDDKWKKSPKYNYSFGDYYPGVVIGHKTCYPFANFGYPVPASMGWLWNARDVPGMKYRRGWSPGVIGKSVAKLMTFKCPRGSKDDKKKKGKGKGKGGGGAAGAAGGAAASGGRGGAAGGKGGSGAAGAGGAGGAGAGGAGAGVSGKKAKAGGDTGGWGDDSDADEPLEPKPTLKIQRKGDVFTIQVNPLKDLTELADNEDPYVDCDPMVFKIIKKRSPEEQAKVEARKMVKLKKLRDAEIRKALSEAVEDICKCAYMDVYCNDLTAIDKVIDNCPAFKEPDCICQSESLSSLSSNATWDIEYTPPFGCFDLTPPKRKDFIHVETQYLNSDAGIPDPPKCKKSCTSITKKKPSKKGCCKPCCR